MVCFYGWYLFLNPWFKTTNRFVENKDHIAKLRACFAGLWSLEDSDIVKKAIENPELFVMKPQREGGGLVPLKLWLNTVGKKCPGEKLTQWAVITFQETIFMVMSWGKPSLNYRKQVLKKMQHTSLCRGYFPPLLQQFWCVMVIGIRVMSFQKLEYLVLI